MFYGKLTSLLIGLQVFSWITQFIGHGIYEKRAPALTTNILFMFLGPFFVFFECLNLTFDYKAAEKIEYDQIVLADIAFYRNQHGYP